MHPLRTPTAPPSKRAELKQVERRFSAKHVGMC
jgi:hypothetical protein